MTTIELKKTIRIISASQTNIRLTSNNNNNDIELCRKIKIKINRKFFNLIVVTNKEIEIFILGKDCL